MAEFIYTKPMVLEVGDIAEGIYAASGEVIGENHDTEDQCWTIDITRDQIIAHEGIVKFRIKAMHPNAIHISRATTVIIAFNQIITSARFEGFDVSISGTTVTLTRQSHGNAYGSLDQYDTLLEVTCKDPNTLAPLSYSIDCTKDYNVQGGI